MATWTTNIAAAQQQLGNFMQGGPTTIPGSLNDTTNELGDLRFIQATYTMTGSEAAGDIIQIAWLEPGYCVLPNALSIINTNGVGATATLNIGDTDNSTSADATRYASGLNVAAAASVPFAGGDAIYVPYFTGVSTPPTAGTSLATEIYAGGGCWLQAVFATLVTPTAGHVLVFRIAVLNTN